MTPADRVTAVVLAGGSSRRMGRDKALLEHDGTPWLARTVALARGVVECVVVAGRAAPPGWPFDDVVCLPDDEPNQGPLGGLVTGLRHAEGDVLVLACDMPKLEEQALRWLLEEAARVPEAAAVVTRLTGSLTLEPLFAVYRRGARAEAESRLARGERAMFRLARALAAVVVEPPAALAPQLVNVNTPEDWAALESGS